MVSQIRGLAYVDESTGQAALIATLKADVVGEIHLPNQVVWNDAFEGVGNVSVWLTYTRQGFEQDLLLQGSSDLPDPESLGMNPDNVSVQLWTAILESPNPTVQAGAPGTGAGAALDFGSMSIGQGRAFLLPDTGQEPGISISPQWVDQEGMRFILEGARYRSIREALDKLPQASLPPKQRTARLADARSRALPILRQLPPPPARPARQESRPMRLVSDQPRAHGLVLDYQILSSGLSNWVFAALSQ